MYPWLNFVVGSNDDQDYVVADNTILLRAARDLNLRPGSTVNVPVTPVSRVWDDLLDVLAMAGCIALAILLYALFAIWGSFLRTRCDRDRRARLDAAEMMRLLRALPPPPPPLIFNPAALRARCVTEVFWLVKRGVLPPLHRLLSLPLSIRLEMHLRDPTHKSMRMSRATWSSRATARLTSCRTPRPTRPA